MTSQSFNPFSSDYRNAFGNSYIRQFGVYVSPEERIGRITEVRANAEGRLQDIVVALDAPANRQIIVPLNQTQIDQRMQRVYVSGVSKAELMNFPVADSSHAAYPSTVVPTPSTTHPVRSSMPLEASAPLEASSPLGASAPLDDRSRYTTSPVTSPTVTHQPLTVAQDQPGELLNHDVQAATNPNPGTTIRLHEERLVVDRNKRRKVGEVIVRKEIETRMIEVPVRHEKLIVEQVSPVYEQLAVVNLESNRSELQDIASDRLPARTSVSGDFTSAEAASRFLDAIAHHPNAGHEKIQIRIILREGTDQATYQQWLERYLG